MYISYLEVYNNIVHSSDVADVIKRKLERINSRAAGLQNAGPIDVFTVIHQSGLARQISWEAQVEEAVRDETDDFWQQVWQICNIFILLYSCITYAFLSAAGSKEDSTITS